MVANCRFSHIEHWLDPGKIEDLWYFDGMPASLERANLSFTAAPERFLFMGHYHRWLIVGSDGTVTWDISQPRILKPADRYLIVTGAVLNGWCATFDSVTAELTPIRCDAGARQESTGHQSHEYYH